VSSFTPKIIAKAAAIRGYSLRNSAAICARQKPRAHLKKRLYLFGLGVLKMFEKIHRRKWERRDWAVFAAIIVIGVSAIAMRQIANGQGDITGTLSNIEPPMKQDGTAAHPYADASQCPPSTDLVFWPSGRMVPSIPPGLSVCVVGGQPFSTDPNLEVRDH
jgi:hypothetical protein